MKTEIEMPFVGKVGAEAIRRVKVEWGPGFGDVEIPVGDPIKTRVTVCFDFDPADPLRYGRSIPHFGNP